MICMTTSKPGVTSERGRWVNCKIFAAVWVSYNPHHVPNTPDPCYYSKGGQPHKSLHIQLLSLFKFNFAGGCKASWLLVSLTFFFVCTAHTRRNWSMWGSTGVHLRIKQLQKPNFIFCHYVGTIIITNRDSCREKRFDIHDGSYSFLDSAACMKMGQGETILKWSR